MRPPYSELYRLADEGLLESVGQLSTVSGGSLVIAALDRHPLASVGRLVLGLRCTFCPGSAANAGAAWPAQVAADSEVGGAGNTSA